MWLSVRPGRRPSHSLWLFFRGNCASEYSEANYMVHVLFHRRAGGLLPAGEMR